MTAAIGLSRKPLRGWSARVAAIWARRSGDALMSTHCSPFADTAMLAWLRGLTRGSPAQAKLQTGQRQFHCGNPPPAAEPRTTAIKLIQLKRPVVVDQNS